MISPTTIQQITSRIDIIEVIGEYVKLRKRGVNYIGNCPFHHEKTPSFTVSPVKEIYKCFGCGKSGNTIGFVMEHEKYSYVEALKWLAAKYNIEVEETEVSPAVKLQQQAADSLYAINTFAQKHFTTNLFDSEEGTDVALSYLKQRGFREDIIRKFQLGYNLAERDDFTKAALKNQFNPELLQKAGLVVMRSDGSNADNYRGRIIFPVHNNTGKIIGFGARIIRSNEKSPKYINTPENELYSKSRILYGTYFGRQAIDRQDECLLVEGYTDVLSLHQAGIENVVASGGTSLTTEQLRLIKKFTNNLTIIYDGDNAGIKAALRGLDMAIEEGLNVKVVLIPDNEDPDSYVNKVGASAFNSFIAANRQDFVLFQLQVMLKEAGSDLARKSEVVNKIAETLSKIDKAEDFTRQQDYVRQCSEILKIDENGLNNLVNKFKREKITKDENRIAAEVQQTPQETDTDDATLSLLQQDDAQEKNVVRVLLEYGLQPWDEERTVAEYIFEELQQFSFDNADYEHVAEVYRNYYEQGKQPTLKTLLYEEDETVKNLVISINVVPFELSPNWDNVMEGLNINNRDVSREDVQMSINYFKLRKIKRMFDENQKDIEKATSFTDQLDLIRVHQFLKAEEQKITRQLGTVILK